jgi:mono/diheme cytochrome c family protein
MRKLSFLTTAICIILFSCNKNTKTNLNAVFNESNLQQQLFDINITRDTTLLTASGCVVKIPAGSLLSDNNIVKLEIKEAMNLKDILLAGLTTMSGKQTLSSAGMIYINAAEGTKVEIKKALEVLVPTKTFNPNMQVYKGTKLDNGKIDWQNPTALAEDETTKKISVGEQIFKANCSNCHKMDMDYTGPSLLGITYRRPKKWLYDFTKNPAKMIGGDIYSNCLYKKWKPTIMTGYPNFNNEVLDSLYAYIKAETDKNPKSNIEYWKTCCDSCELYKNELGKLQSKKNKLLDEQDKFYNLDRTVQLNNRNTSSRDSLSVINEVTSTYYTINVKTFGWFNVDILYEDEKGSKQSNLFVRIQGEYQSEYSVSLVIPNRKIFMEGNIPENGKEYVFKETNGEIILPQNELCYIVAYAHKDEKIFFGKTSFVAGFKQTITIETKETTKEIMMKEFSKIGIQSEVEDVKNVKEIKNTERKIDSLKKYLPKNCECDFPKEILEEPITGVAEYFNRILSSRKSDKSDYITNTGFLQDVDTAKF